MPAFADAAHSDREVDDHRHGSSDTSRYRALKEPIVRRGRIAGREGVRVDLITNTGQLALSRHPVEGELLPQAQPSQHRVEADLERGQRPGQAVELGTVH